MARSVQVSRLLLSSRSACRSFYIGQCFGAKNFTSLKLFQVLLVTGTWFLKRCAVREHGIVEIHLERDASETGLYFHYLNLRNWCNAVAHAAATEMDVSCWYDPETIWRGRSMNQFNEWKARRRYSIWWRSTCSPYQSQSEESNPIKAERNLTANQTHHRQNHPHIQVPVSKTDTHLVIKWSVRLSRNQCSFCGSRKFIEEMKLSVFDGARPYGWLFRAKRCFRVGRYTEDHLFELTSEGIELVLKERWLRRGLQTGHT